MVQMTPAVAREGARSASLDYCVVECCYHLTPREIEIVRHLMLGMKEAVVAKKMRISRHTVHSQIASVHRKLGVSGRAMLVAKVIALDIISVDEVRVLLENAQTGD